MRPDDITGPEALVDLNAILLGSPDILDANEALPLALEDGVADDEDSDGGLAGVDAGDAAQDDVADVGEDLTLLGEAGPRDGDGGQLGGLPRSDLGHPLSGAGRLLGLGQGDGAQ